MKDTITIRGRVADLWRDECGWSENACWARECEITVPSGTSDNVIARKVKAALGITGMRADQWCGADWCWRDGAIGAYADVVF